MNKFVLTLTALTLSVTSAWAECPSQDDSSQLQSFTVDVLPTELVVKKDGELVGDVQVQLDEKSLLPSFEYKDPNGKVMATAKMRSWTKGLTHHLSDFNAIEVYDCEGTKLGAMVRNFELALEPTFELTNVSRYSYRYYVINNSNQVIARSMTTDHSDPTDLHILYFHWHDKGLPFFRRPYNASAIKIIKGGPVPSFLILTKPSKRDIATIDHRVMAMIFAFKIYTNVSNALVDKLTEDVLNRLILDNMNDE